MNLANKTNVLFSKFSKKTYIVVGIFIACLSMLPYILLGTGSIITYHDQLDGELLCYILTAKYLFTDISIYPELMNGLPSTGAVPPAPLFVLLYTVFRPFIAFMLTQWIINIVGFLGMFLLLSKLTKQDFISFCISLIFMFMPFYPVYGLCIPGQPLLWYSVFCLFTMEKECGLWNSEKLFSKILCICGIILYGLASSLVLVGFACLIILFCIFIYHSILWFCSKKSTVNTVFTYTPLISLMILGLTYLLTNLSLIKQVLFPAMKYVSHKSEMVISPQGFADSFISAITKGVSYAQSWHTVIIITTIVVLITIIISFVKAHNRRHVESTSASVENSPIAYRIMMLSLFIVFIGLLYAFYHGNVITEFRNHSDGLLKELNLDRITWLLPVTWCVLSGYILTYTVEKWTILSSVLRRGFIFIILCFWGITVLWNSSLKPNLSKLAKGGNYYALDWKSFFAEDIFEQIDSEIGKSKEDYRVISVGIYPAAAAYNGFYCLDGYSNNYPLNYKHTFREIMNGELEKSAYVRDFFDNWGNRCYITTAEQANYYTFEKKWNSVIYDLDLNIEKLKEMNCEYVFSAAYIMNAEEIGLKLIRETPFEAEGSWYHIWVYEIK